MAQARRTKKAKAKANPRRGSGRNTRSFLAAIRQGMGFFITGVFTGVLGIVLWQGYQSDAQGDMGSGLKAMIMQSKQQAAMRAAESLAPEPVLVDNAPRIKPQYDFYTVLPEIEEVLPKDTPELPMQALIQKVTIENKNYFRVRLGPYSDYGTMTSDDYKLSQLGFKAMRLRVSRAG
jgi:hypothetical protein